MKRIFFVAILVGCFVLCGCQDKRYLQFEQNISEIRNQLFSYSDEEMCVKFISGQREKNYVVDGKHTDLIDFGILSFDFKLQSFSVQTKAKYILILGTRRMDGDLIYNPFDETFVVDIKEQVSPDTKMIAKIVIDDFQKEVTLECVTKDWQISALDALKNVVKEKKKDFDALLTNGEVAAEVYIKMTQDVESSEGRYYWYVSIVPVNGDRLAYLVDYLTGEIVARN